LLLLIRSELERLRDKRLNDDPELREIEELEEQVVRLRGSTLNAERGIVPEASAAQAAKSFGDYVHDWFDKNHDRILTDGFETLIGTFKAGAFLSATALCASLHVDPTLAATVSGVLIGGKSVADSIKAAAEFWKRKKPPKS
jgi:hypothetical protein